MDEVVGKRHADELPVTLSLPESVLPVAQLAIDVDTGTLTEDVTKLGWRQRNRLAVPAGTFSVSRIVQLKRVPHPIAILEEGELPVGVEVSANPDSFQGLADEGIVAPLLDSRMEREKLLKANVALREAELLAKTAQGNTIRRELSGLPPNPHFDGAVEKYNFLKP